MLVRCHHCHFRYFLNPQLRCPMCGTPTSFTFNPLIKMGPEKRVAVRPPGLPVAAVDLVMERLFGRMYQTAQYPVLCALAAMVNFAG